MANEERAKELLPTVLLTLLSVVQALALEAAWSSVRDLDFLYAGGMPAWVGWLQYAAIFQGMVVIWLFYIGIVMRFSWVPTTWDSLAPFVLGAGELAMIQLIELQQMSAWFFVLAAIFAFSTWISNRMFRAGGSAAAQALVGENGPARGRFDQLAPRAFVSVLFAMGLVVTLAGSTGVVALLCVVAANGLLLVQGWLIHRYWTQWVGASTSSL